MSKKVYFYKMVIREKGIKSKKSAYNLVNEVIDKKGITNVKDGVKITSLSISKDQRPITLDILNNDETYFFGRLGKVKPNSSMQVREYNTLGSEDVLSENELSTKGVEICTYFIINYKTNIVGFLYGQSAPSGMSTLC